MRQTSTSISQHVQGAGTKSAWKKFCLHMSRYYEYYLFILPAVAYYIIFAYMPIYGLQIAFKDYKIALGFSRSPWVGLKHFREYFQSFYFWKTIRNTLALSVYSLLAGMPWPILLALMLNELKNERFKKVYQTISYAPHFISLVVLVGMLQLFFNANYGAVNTVLKMLGMETHAFMQDPHCFRHLYVWSNVWQQLGWNSIIYVAALSGIDPGLHEAAMIDGASRLQRIRYINIPMLVPTIVIMLIMNTGSIMSVGFIKVFLMHNDLISDVTMVTSMFVYQRGVIDRGYSFSAAVDMFTNVINFLLLFSVNQISKKLSGVSFF